MALKLRNLKEQVIVLTGATSGIGLVTARLAAARGTKLVLAARNEDALKKLTDEINQTGGDAMYVVTDVGKAEDMTRVAIEAVNKFGNFDTWIITPAFRFMESLKKFRNKIHASYSTRTSGVWSTARWSRQGI